MKKSIALILAGILLIVASVMLDSIWWGDNHDITEAWTPMGYVVVAVTSVCLVGGVVVVIKGFKQKKLEKQQAAMQQPNVQPQVQAQYQPQSQYQQSGRQQSRIQNSLDQQ